MSPSSSGGGTSSFPSYVSNSTCLGTEKTRTRNDVRQPVQRVTTPGGNIPLFSTNASVTMFSHKKSNTNEAHHAMPCHAMPCHVMCLVWLHGKTTYLIVIGLVFGLAFSRAHDDEGAGVFSVLVVLLLPLLLLQLPSGSRIVMEERMLEAGVSSSSALPCIVSSSWRNHGERKNEGDESRNQPKRVGPVRFRLDQSTNDSRLCVTRTLLWYGLYKQPFNNRKECRICIHHTLLLL